MSDYIVHGKKGNGKSLVVVGRMRDALSSRKPVATNLDLYLHELLPHHTRDVLCYRLPDKPTREDLDMLGFGSPEVDESTYGLVALDECAAMLNARTFADKTRQALLDWFVHSRKLGWDTYFICQNLVQIDKQVRESLVELSVGCKRMDKVRIPFIGPLTKHLLGFELRPPKFHVATVRYGVGHDAMVSDRWTYTGKSLYKGYNTRQVFRDDYPDGIYCLLTPWHTHGRHGSGKLRLSKRAVAWLRSTWRAWTTAPARPAPKPALPIVAKIAKLPPDQRIRHVRALLGAC